MSQALSLSSTIGRAVRAIKGLFGVSFVHPAGNYGGTAALNAFLVDALPTESDRLRHPYLQSGTVATAFNRIAEDTASIDLEVVRDGEDEPIENHPLLRRFKRPNGYMYGDDLVVATVLSELIFGEWFWWFPDLRITSGRLIDGGELPGGEIHILNPRAVEDDTTSGELRWYLREQSGRTLLDSERLVHGKRWNPYRSIRGLPKIASIIRDLQGDYAASVWNDRFFSEQGGAPAIVFKPPAKAISVPGAGIGDPTSREDFEDRWKFKHRHRSGVGVAPPGWDLMELGVAAKDMDFGALRMFAREQVLALCGVPPLIAGYLDTTIKYNAQEQKEIYWDGTITSQLKRFVATLNYDFLPKIGLDAFEVRPDWADVKGKTDDLVGKTTVAQQWFGMGLSKKVINERLDLGWSEDDIEDYDVGYLSFGLAPVSEVLEPPEPPPMLPPPGEEDEDEDEENAPPPRAARRFSTDEVKRTALWRMVMAQTYDLEKRFDKTMRSHLQNLRREVEANLQQARGWLALDARKRANGRKMPTGPDDPLFDTDKADEAITRKSVPLFRATLLRGGESIAGQLDVGLSFSLEDPRVVALLTDLSVQIRRVNRTLARQIMQEIGRGIEAGDSPQEIAGRIRGVFDTTASRSRRIARTEVGRAFNAARDEGMDQAGVDKHEWLSSRDPRVRDTHRAEDGNVVRRGEPFPVTRLLYPQAEGGDPAETIQCRCIAIPVLSR